MNVIWIKKWQPIVLSLLIGFASGTVLGQWHARQCFSRFWEKKGSSHHGEKEMRERMLEHMSRELQLSEKQKQQVAAIFETKRPQMTALHAEMRSKFEALRKKHDPQGRFEGFLGKPMPA